MSRDFILSAVMAAACVSFITIPLSGHISDRIGRRRMYLIGVVATGLFGFLYFGMVDTAICVGGLHRHRALAHSARYPVRAAGGARRGILHAALALGRLSWLGTDCPLSRKCVRRSK